MKKLNNLNGNFEYELLDKNQHVVGLREKLTVLYPHHYSDILWWELHDPSLESEGYYKLFYYEQSVLKHIILFKYFSETQRKIFQISKKCTISVEDIENISYILFYEFDKVQQIIFQEIFEPDLKQSPKMVFEKPINDIIISDLPNSMDVYMKSLGKPTRKKIQLMTNRIARDFPDFKVHYYEKNDILFEQIEKLVSLNRIRMITTGEKPGITDTDCKILYQYALTSGFGFLCVCVIDGKIVGGTLNFIIGERAYLQVIAHDNLYNQYSMGQIALVNVTKFLIEEKKNIKYFHLMRGSQEYKFRHGGISHDLYTIRVFRNNDVRYFGRKSVSIIKKYFRKYKIKLRSNKIIFTIYTKLKKMKTKLMYFKRNKKASS